MYISELYIDSENICLSIFQFYFLFIFFFLNEKNYSKYTVYVGKHYCYKANVMYFFTISIFNQNETRHRTKDKSTKSKTKNGNENAMISSTQQIFTKL